MPEGVEEEEEPDAGLVNDVEMAADDTLGDRMGDLAEEVEDDVDAVPPSPEPADLAEEVEDEFVPADDTQANRMGAGPSDRLVKPLLPSPRAG